MIYEEEMKTGIEDAGKNGFITNRAILRILENIGGYHSDNVGYGLLDIEESVEVVEKLIEILEDKYENRDIE